MTIRRAARVPYYAPLHPAYGSHQQRYSTPASSGVNS
jgi:hypothetical protein